jgi:broad specificity phosphatase PhoE
MKAIFVRHGESTGNIDIPCDNHTLSELTKKGQQQALNLARSWTEEPSLIVTSTFLRAQQTAQPTIARYPNAPVEIWEIQEFTYLEPSRWKGTSRDIRLPHIRSYWKRANPYFCDGPGAESFDKLLERADGTIKRLRGMPDKAIVYLFSHGQFMRAVSLIVSPPSPDADEMDYFWKQCSDCPIGNCDCLVVEFEEFKASLG